MLETCKKAAAEKAATFVKDHMTVGLGTGSTASYFIEALGHLHAQGLLVKVVASSQSSFILAQKMGLPLLDLLSIKSLDLYVDGADEIDPLKQMIKGGGGAFFREKILAYMSQEMIIIVDETKIAPRLGQRPLPVEILPFGMTATLHHLQTLGYTGKLRHTADGALFLTDNSHPLYDIALPSSHNVLHAHEIISRVPGVLETGFFPSHTGRVVIGFKDGAVIVQ